MTEKELRELDAWIAEHVMGWVWWYCKQSNEAMLVRPGPDWPLHQNFKLVGKRPQGCTDNSHLATDNYTTDPAAAMMVLEKCIEYKKSCLALDKDKAGNFTIANIDRMAEATFIVPAYTLPLAICLFAKQLFHAQEKETQVHSR